MVLHYWRRRRRIANKFQMLGLKVVQKNRDIAFLQGAAFRHWKSLYVAGSHFAEGRGRAAHRAAMKTVLAAWWRTCKEWVRRRLCQQWFQNKACSDLVGKSWGVWVNVVRRGLCGDNLYKCVQERFMRRALGAWSQKVAWQSCLRSRRRAIAVALQSRLLRDFFKHWATMVLRILTQVRARSRISLSMCHLTVARN